MSHPPAEPGAPWIEDLPVEPGTGVGAEPQRPVHSRGHQARGCLAVVVAMAVILGGGAFLLARASGFLAGLGAGPQDYSGDGKGSVVFRVKAGDSLTAIGGRLAEQDVVASSDAFVNASQGETIEVGYYELRKQMSGESAVSYLLDGEHRVEASVAIEEGLTVEETMAAIVKQTDLSSKQVLAAARKPAALGLPAYAGGELEGYLFPATYVAPPDTSATELLGMMVDRFEQAAAEAGLEEAAARLDVSPHELVTVASLVQAEAQRDEDFGKVAQVVYNRVEEGMPLQFDSTVHYATDTVGEVYTTAQQRRSKSPYNTYLVTGLPPGPIGSPGDQALAAAAEPTDGDWLYFVTVDLSTGETQFAEGLREHNRNVAELDAYCQSSDAC